MNKCRECGKEFGPSKPRALGSIVGMQFGFEFTMIILGGYAAACFYTFQSVFALVASLVVGVFIFYALLPKTADICEGCTNDQPKP